MASTSTDRWVSRLSVTAVALAVAVVSGTAVAAAVPSSRRWLGLERALPAAYPVGSRVDVPLRAWGHGRSSVVVFGSASCPAFRRSLAPLAAVTRAGAGRVDVAVVADQDVSDQFLATMGVDRSALHVVRGEDLAVQVAPTVLVVDSAGIVRYQREGEVRTGDEREIISALDRLADRRP